MHGLVALVTLLALFVYFWMIMRVGQARGKYGVQAPSVIGDPVFERHFRVQSNTGEGLLLFLPSLWIFAIYLNDTIAAALGAIWVIGRVLYMFGYVEDPKKRSLGFGVQALATLVLMLGSLGAVAWRLLKGGL